MSTSLAMLRELSDKRKTQQQQFLTVLLDEKDADVDTLITDLVYIAKNAERPTPTWDMVDDYKTRLTATKLLLELRWDYTPSKQSMNVNLGFASLFYWNKKDNNDWETVIQAG